jgi:dolichol-phosphate mannosyltransferase
MKKTLTIIIPCYNEEATISQIIQKVIESDSLDFEKEIIIVNDGSTDNSQNKINEFPDFIKKINYSKNRGKGYAIRKGLENSFGELVLIQDADLEYDPHNFPNLLAPFIQETTSVVYGIRQRDTIALQYITNPFFWGGQFINHMANILFNFKVQDIHVGYKIFKRNLLKDIQLKNDGFAFCHELTFELLQNKIPIIEVPVTYNPRKVNEGKKISAKDGALIICYMFSRRARVFLGKK